MNGQQRDDAIRMSAIALHHARVNDWTAAGAQVQQLQTAYGGDGIQVLMIGLADTMLIHQGAAHRPADDDVMVLPLWVTTDGELSDVDDVRPEIRWAGRFVAARAADDEETAAALVNSCTSDEEFSECVVALLEITATTLNLMSNQ